MAYLKLIKKDFLNNFFNSLKNKVMLYFYYDVIYVARDNNI